MDDSRQPGATAAAVTQGEPLRLPADPGHPSMGSGLLRLVAHTGRRLHRHDSDIEPAGDGGGEQAGPGTEIKHWQAACRRQPDGQGGPPALQSSSPSGITPGHDRSWPPSGRSPPVPSCRPLTGRAAASVVAVLVGGKGAGRCGPPGTRPRRFLQDSLKAGAALDVAGQPARRSGRPCPARPAPARRRAGRRRCRSSAPPRYR
jgi:hypothetical protein